MYIKKDRRNYTKARGILYVKERFFSSYIQKDAELDEFRRFLKKNCIVFLGKISIQIKME